MEATLCLFQELKKDYSHNKRYSTFLVLCAFNISTSLPPMWTKFKFRRPRHMWVEFVVGSVSFAPRAFSPGTPVFPLLKNLYFQIPIRPGIWWTKNHFVDVLSPNHYLFIFYLKFDRHPSKLINTNRQSSKLPRH